MAELYEYQYTGVEWMISHEQSNKVTFGEDSLYINGGILADEVGLGKTLMSINLISKNPKPNTLILAPKSLIIQWKTEFEKFAKSISVEVTDDNTYNFNKNLNKIHVVIASHSRLNSKSVTDFNDISFCKNKWDRVIIDEAHIIKNKL